MYIYELQMTIKLARLKWLAVAPVFRILPVSVNNQILTTYPKI